MTLGTLLFSAKKIPSAHSSAGMGPVAAGWGLRAFFQGAPLQAGSTVQHYADAFLAGIPDIRSLLRSRHGPLSTEV